MSTAPSRGKSRENEKRGHSVALRFPVPGSSRFWCKQVVETPVKWLLHGQKHSRLLTCWISPRRATATCCTNPPILTSLRRHRHLFLLAATTCERIPYIPCIKLESRSNLVGLSQYAPLLHGEEAKQQVSDGGQRLLGWDERGRRGPGKPHGGLCGPAVLHTPHQPFQ